MIRVEIRRGIQGIQNPAQRLFREKRLLPSNNCDEIMKRIYVSIYKL